VTRVFVPHFTTRPKIKWENKFDEMVNLPGLQLTTENSRNSENISGKYFRKRDFQDFPKLPNFLIIKYAFIIIMVFKKAFQCFNELFCSDCLLPSIY